MLKSAQQKSPQLTLVLLGEQGSGKSASGNTILGEKAFASMPSSKPVTTECETQTTSICGTEVTVIDTPDFFDDDQDQSRHIQRCRQLCEGRLCVYLLVIQIGRFTDGEKDILERLEKALQTRIRDRTIILFTRGDDLAKQSHVEYVRDTNPSLKNLIEECGGKYLVFHNRSTPLRWVMEESLYIWFKGKWLNVWYYFLRNLFGSTSTNHFREAENLVKELMEKIKLLQATDGESGFLNRCVIL